MSENKTGKYLKYAIGEIILVVLGILIALGINNWNEDRKSENNEQALIKKLQKENNYNIDWLQKDKIYRNEIPKTLEEFHNFLEQGNLETNIDSLKSYLFDALRATSYTFTHSNLNNYLNLHNENATELNKELNILYTYQKDLEIFTNKALDYKISEIYEPLENDVDFMSGNIMSYGVLKSLKFRNKLYLSMDFEDEINRMYHLTLKQMKKVDSLINQRLK